MDRELHEPPPEVRAEVWNAMDFQYCHIGYLVTEANDVNSPIAFVDLSETSEAAALGTARQIASDPRRAGSGRCMDLRPYAKADSINPTPPWLYGLWCEPLDGGELVQPSPYCRFQRDRLNRQYERLTVVDAATETADRSRPTVLTPASRRNGRAASPTAA